MNSKKEEVAVVHLHCHSENQQSCRWSHVKDVGVLVAGHSYHLHFS